MSALEFLGVLPSFGDMLETLGLHLSGNDMMIKPVIKRVMR